VCGKVCLFGSAAENALTFINANASTTIALPNEVGVAEATQVELNTHLPCQLHTEHKRL